MITPAQAKTKFGEPGSKESLYMQLWTVPKDIRDALAHVQFTLLGTKGFPMRIYLNTYLKAPLEKALRNIIARGLTKEIISWDGCYMIRNSQNSKSWSLHAWGLAVDVNAAANPLGRKPTLSKGVVKCFTDAGLHWGGEWSRPDGMHFQLASFTN